MKCPVCGSTHFGKLSNGTLLCRGHKTTGEPCTYYVEKRESSPPSPPDRSGEFDLHTFLLDSL